MIHAAFIDEQESSYLRSKVTGEWLSYIEYNAHTGTHRKFSLVNEIAKATPLTASYYNRSNALRSNIDLDDFESVQVKIVTEYTILE